VINGHAEGHTNFEEEEKMLENNMALTPLEIEKVREAVRLYADEYLSETRYVVIERLDRQGSYYDFDAACVIYFEGDRGFNADELREEEHILGINRNEQGGFEVPMD
jgi:hypothetical protein